MYRALALRDWKRSVQRADGLLQPHAAGSFDQNHITLSGRANERVARLGRIYCKFQTILPSACLACAFQYFLCESLYADDESRSGCDRFPAATAMELDRLRP